MADVKKIATRDSYGNALKELGAEFDNLVVLRPAATQTMLASAMPQSK